MSFNALKANKTAYNIVCRNIETFLYFSLYNNIFLRFHNTFFNSFVFTIIIKTHEEYESVTILQQLQNISIIEHNCVTREIFHIIQHLVKRIIPLNFKMI